MPHLPHGEARDRLIAGIHRLAEVLARVTDKKHAGAGIDNVIAMMARHLLETCLLVLGPTFEQEWASQIFDNRAESHGLCRFCHIGVLVTEKGMCEQCWQQAEEDDRTVEEIVG